MSEYRVGQINSLFSSTPGEKKSTSPSTLKTLFSSRVGTTKHQLKVDPKVPQQSPKVNSVASPKDTEGGDVVEEYSTPSRKYRVQEEDKKERKWDLEKESRTVFVGNLPCKITTKLIRRRFKVFGEIETIRLRSGARPDSLTTKRVAVIKRTFHEHRHNINAYIKFKNRADAVKSCSLNGSEFDSRTIRVDLADSSKEKASRDQSRSVFLGNLSFKIEEDEVQSHFGSCGRINYVRLVRDSATGMGKGFGYVNFAETDSVELALKLNGSNLCQRDIRVTRATNAALRSTSLKRCAESRKKTLKVSAKKAGKPKAKATRKPEKAYDFQGSVGMKGRDMGKHTKRRTRNQHKQTKTAKKPRKTSKAK